jgi:Tfp pilus assembly protein PilN
VRAVNLIPPEDRRGERAPTRSGPLSYMVVGALALALVAVTAVVLTQNKIADDRSEITSLKVQEADAKARAVRLQAYADFASLQQTRTQTVSSLAESRFDWDRVLRELALVIPRDVFLTAVTASVSPNASDSSAAVGAAAGAGASTSLRGQILGPALEITGCAQGHTGVAEFMTALKDIDGVTRVGVSDSTESGSSGAASGSTSSSSCSGNHVAQFDLVAAFDSVAIDPTTQAPVPVSPAAPAVDPTGIGDAQQAEAAGRESIQRQTDKAHDAVTTLVPGTVSGK